VPDVVVGVLLAGVEPDRQQRLGAGPRYILGSTDLDVTSVGLLSREHL
jgi:hypothetical protein